MDRWMDGVREPTFLKSTIQSVPFSHPALLLLVASVVMPKNISSNVSDTFLYRLAASLSNFCQNTNLILQYTRMDDQESLAFVWCTLKMGVVIENGHLIMKFSILK